MKSNKEQTDNKLNDHREKFNKIHNNEQINKMDRKDTEPKLIQPVENMNREHFERPPQSTANKSMVKHISKKTSP